MFQITTMVVAGVLHPILFYLVARFSEFTLALTQAATVVVHISDTLEYNPIALISIVCFAICGVFSMLSSSSCVDRCHEGVAHENVH